MNILIDGQTLTTPDLERGIGRVFVGLVENLVIRNVSHRWFIAAPKGCDVSPLAPDVLDRVRVVEVPAIDLARGYADATKTHRNALEKICLDEGIDLYWSPNPLMLNVVLPVGLSGARSVCTVFDIIPARLPDAYQSEWSAAARAEYASRLEGLEDWADRLVFISKAAAADFADLAPAAQAKSRAIPIAIDFETFWASAAIKADAGKPYVLMVAGADPRKNMARTIEAFAMLSRKNRASEDMALRIVGALDADSKRRLEAVAAAKGVADRVQLLGRVDDARLGRLYREASALVFASLYEGFGLPVVEALASGIPVVVSDRPELREAAGPHGVYCDPTDPADIAEKLGGVLKKPWGHRHERLAAIEWAQRFTWERAADGYASIFSEISTRRQRPATPAQRPRIAWVSPWLPIRSGIADHSFELVRELRERLDIEIFTESKQRPTDALGLPIHAIDRMSERRSRFDVAIYHLGNNSDYHREIYKAAWKDPGIVVLHDYNIHPFLHSAYYGTREEFLYRDALEESHGASGLAHFDRLKARQEQPGIWHYAASSAIAKRSIATVVHSAWVSDQLQQEGVQNVHTVALGATVRADKSRSSPAHSRSKVGLPSDGFVIGVFGFLNRHKRIPSVIAACRRLWDAGFPITLLLVGESADAQLDLEAEIDKHVARDFVRATGFVDDETYWAYLDATDVMVNLRFPSMGESSASLMRGLGNATPCIVSDFAQFAELPDSVCWKVSTTDGEIDELTACLAELLREPDVRATLGRNAREFVASLSSFEYAAKAYETVVYEALAALARS